VSRVQRWEEVEVAGDMGSIQIGKYRK
jgi:hypothetical protein